MAEKKARISKKRNISDPIAHIKSTYNNTIISITDANGNVILSNSAGRSGFKGARKGTPYAAEVAGEKIGKEAILNNLKDIHIKLQGTGSGRESAIKGLISSGLKIKSIEDVTPVPHNGCRPEKKPRG